jgi:hypothetical protein
MIREIDEQLVQWATATADADDVTVSLAAPAVGQTGSGISLYLLGFAETPPASTASRAPLQCTLRYLVSAWAEEPETAHELLVNLLFAAMEAEAYEVELGEISAETWLAFQTIPQPAFILRVLARRPRPEPDVPLVSEHVVEAVPAVMLFGVLQGPGGIPIAGARVELRNSDRSATTGPNGDFRIANIPAGRPAQLRVIAKGRTFNVTVNQPTTAEKPVVIPFNPT